jgi:hypothetical protein
MTAMSSAFSAAVDAIFRDANVAEDAIWRAGGAGDGFAVRVIRKSPDEVVGFGSSRAVMATVLIDARAAEIASPAAGDTVEIGGDLFAIIGTPVRDSLGLVWTCEASPRD